MSDLETHVHPEVLNANLEHFTDTVEWTRQEKLEVLSSPFVLDIMSECSELGTPEVVERLELHCNELDEERTFSHLMTPEESKELAIQTDFLYRLMHVFTESKVASGEYSFADFWDDYLGPDEALVWGEAVPEPTVTEQIKDDLISPELVESLWLSLNGRTSAKRATTLEGMHAARVRRKLEKHLAPEKVKAKAQAANDLTVSFIVEGLKNSKHRPGRNIDGYKDLRKFIENERRNGTTPEEMLARFDRTAEDLDTEAIVLRERTADTLHKFWATVALGSVILASFASLRGGDDVATLPAAAPQNITTTTMLSPAPSSVPTTVVTAPTVTEAPTTTEAPRTAEIQATTTTAPSAPAFDQLHYGKVYSRKIQGTFDEETLRIYNELKNKVPLDQLRATLLIRNQYGSVEAAQPGMDIGWKDCPPNSTMVLAGDNTAEIFAQRNGLTEAQVLFLNHGFLAISGLCAKTKATRG